MRQETIEIFTFNELSDDAKQKAMDWYREGQLDYDWWDYVFEDATIIGEILGINITNIYFSGFASQGDGACFEGDYSYKKGSAAAIADYAPLDKTLHEIASNLQAIQRKQFYGLNANVKQRGHYSHSGCTDIDVYHDEYMGVGDDAYYSLRDELRNFMDWIYTKLEAEYDYLTSDENVVESIICNEYEFTADGSIH